jgi:GNAT superfamily N-acetyltransferase
MAGGTERAASIVYTELPLHGGDEKAAPLEQCARLFSEHYGTWRLKQTPVKMTVERLKRDHASVDGARLVYARVGEDVVGHAFGVVFYAELTNPSTGKREKQSVAWLTQLVVHTEYRKLGIASKLCHNFWMREHSVWGLVTSHPHAVRALETALRLCCDPVRIAHSAQELLDQSPVPYVRGRCLKCKQTQSVINTNFDVDHSEIQRFLEEQPNWNLGALEDGWEFFAFVFQDQDANRVRSASPSRAL